MSMWRGSPAQFAAESRSRLLNRWAAMPKLPAVSLHPAPSPRLVPANAALERFRAELIPPTERPDPGVSFVVPDWARGVLLRTQQVG